MIVIASDQVLDIRYILVPVILRYIPVVHVVVDVSLWCSISLCFHLSYCTCTCRYLNFDSCSRRQTDLYLSIDRV